MKITERRLRQIIRSIIKENTELESDEFDIDAAMHAAEDIESALSFALTNESKNNNLKLSFLNESTIKSQMEKAADHVNSRATVSELPKEAEVKIAKIAKAKSKKERIKLATSLCFTLGISIFCAPVLVWGITNMGLIDQSTYLQILNATGGIFGQMLASGIGLTIATAAGADNPDADAAYAAYRAYRKNNPPPY